MRRLLIATTLGLGLAAGGIAVSASASPIGNHRLSATMPVQSVHYDDRARYLEPWHHSHRPVPHTHRQPYQGWHRGYEYSRR